MNRRRLAEYSDNVIGLKYLHNFWVLVSSSIYNSQKAQGVYLDIDCRQRHYHSQIWPTKHERHTTLLLIFSLVSIVASSYEDL